MFVIFGFIVEITFKSSRKFTLQAAGFFEDYQESIKKLIFEFVKFDVNMIMINDYKIFYKHNFISIWFVRLLSKKFYVFELNRLH